MALVGFLIWNIHKDIYRYMYINIPICTISNKEAFKTIQSPFKSPCHSLFRFDSSTFLQYYVSYFLSPYLSFPLYKRSYIPFFCLIFSHPRHSFYPTSIYAHIPCRSLPFTIPIYTFPHPTTSTSPNPGLLAANITVFAPTDAALARLPSNQLLALQSDQVMLQKILGYHVLLEDLGPLRASLDEKVITSSNNLTVRICRYYLLNVGAAGEVLTVTDFEWNVAEITL